jgi:hypothetical protein
MFTNRGGSSTLSRRPAENQKNEDVIEALLDVTDRLEKVAQDLQNRLDRLDVPTTRESNEE